MAESYPVKVKNVYRGPTVVRFSPEISPESIVSGMPRLRLTESSYPRYLDSPPAPHFVKEYGQDYALRVTANNNNRHKDSLENYRLHGDFSPQIDDVSMYNPDSFSKWLDAGTKNMPNKFEYVELPRRTSSSGVMESFRERLADFDRGDTAVPNYVHDSIVLGGVRNNEIGKIFHRIGNLKDHLKGYSKTIDANELTSYLSSLGYPPSYIDWLGEGFMPEDAIYSVDRTKDGKILLTASPNAFEKVSTEAQLFGVTTNDLMGSAFDEEFTHIWRRDFDKDCDIIPLEMKTKAIVRDHYLRLARIYAGDDKLRRRYERLAAFKEYDRQTTKQRYSKKDSSLKELYSKDRAALEEMLSEEAVEKGFSGKEIKDYVASRSREIGEETENPRMSKLEEIAEKDADSKVKETTETKEASNEESQAE